MVVAIFNPPKPPPVFCVLALWRNGFAGIEPKGFGFALEAEGVAEPKIEDLIGAVLVWPKGFEGCDC